MTGHDGYIGGLLLPVLRLAGHEVVGLDSFLFQSGRFGDDGATVAVLRKDVRDVDEGDLEGLDAVIHLAAVSNDPLGDLNPSCTYEINHVATVRLAELARRAGVPRFLFSSSCSLYGEANDGLVVETAPLNPLTAYGHSKALAESGVSKLADDTFSPTFLRNATAYGASSKFRSDLVVNNLSAIAYTTGEVRVMSDGTPWRPLVHVEDIARAFLCMLEAPRDLVHNEAFNVGSTGENYRIRSLAEIVRQAVPGSRVTFAGGAGPDRRDYRVSFERFETTFPHSRPRWKVVDGVRELLTFFERHEMSVSDVTGPRTQRMARVKELISEGLLSSELRWLPAGSVASGTPAQPSQRRLKP